MIEFFKSVWDGIVVAWEYVWATFNVWFNPTIEALKALGIGGIALLVVRYFLPKILEAFNPLASKINEALAQLAALTLKVEDSNVRATKVEDYMVQYLRLSCDVNANSRSLSPEQKEQYAKLAENLRNVGAEKAADKIEEVIEDGKVTKEEATALVKELPAAEVAIKEAAEVAIKEAAEAAVTQVETARKKLRKRG